MNLGSQIKKYRTELNMSQDELAEKIFVSRQSISNWENDKTYPDIKSLLLLSEVFRVSLDQFYVAYSHTVGALFRLVGYGSLLGDWCPRTVLCFSRREA